MAANSARAARTVDAAQQLDGVALYDLLLAYWYFDQFLLCCFRVCFVESIVDTNLSLRRSFVLALLQPVKIHLHYYAISACHVIPISWRLKSSVMPWLTHDTFPSLDDW